MFGNNFWVEPICRTEPDIWWPLETPFKGRLETDYRINGPNFMEQRVWSETNCISLQIPSNLRALRVKEGRKE